MRSRVCAALALLCAGYLLANGLTGLAPVRGEDAPRRPAVLFAGSYGESCSFEVARRLHEAGFDLDDVPQPGLDGQALTWDYVRRYNVLVLMGLGRANADMTLHPRQQQTIETLRRFLAAGGGVLVVPVFGQMATEKPPQDAFLNPLGLVPLFSEMPADPETSVTATAWQIPYALTQNVAPSPITQDVKALWYPVPAYRIGGQHHTVTFTADPSWSVVVKGSRSSQTRGGPLQALNPTEPGTYSSEVPLVACREVGRGRVVCLGIAPQYLFGLPATTTLERIVLDRGSRQIPSDGARLIENALRWLAEPSLGGGELGGAPMKAAMLESPFQVRFGEPFSWPRKVTFPPVEPAYPGVIGARTRYSTGKATVDEWVAAARAKGLAYIVFLEDFPHLTPEEFERLRADCARLSSPEFSAIPGFTIDDEVGNHYFYCGTTFPYPDRKFLSKDGKVFVSRDAEVSPQNPYIRGQLSMTTLDYAYSLASFKLTAGNYLFSQDAAPFANFFANWDAFGIVTARAGKVVEDATRDYLKSVDFGNGPLPMVIDLMDDPAQLGASRWRTVLRLPAQGGAVIGDTLEGPTKIRDYFNGWHFYPDNPSKIYVTSGPEIESWCYAGPRDYEGNSRGDFVWQNYRWVLRGKVSSPVGLKEVAVYDGEVLFRRFLPGGRRAFEFTLDLTHDQQRNLVLIATDTQGGKAVSGEQWDRNHRLEEFMCADRNNQLSYGYVVRKDGTGLLLGGNQTLGTPNKRLAPGISPAGTFKNDALLGAPAFDGAAGGEPEVFEIVAPIGPKGPGPSPDVSESLRVIHSADLHVGESLREHRFADNIGVFNVWHTLWRTEPARDFTVRRRQTFFQVNPDSPLAVFHWRIDIALRRDLPNRGFEVALLATRADTLWTARGSDGCCYSGTWEDTVLSNQRLLRVPFGRGAYVGLLNSPLGGAAVYSLTDGLEAFISLPARQSILIKLPPEAAPQKKGQTKRIDLILVGIPRLTAQTRALPAASTEVVERFWRDFGMDGGKTTYTVTPQAGRVLDRRYVLTVDGSATQCFSGQLSGAPVSSLPIAVSGLHNRWSCYLYDRGRKQARPVGVCEGKGWATVCPEGRLDLFIGHPVLVDDPRLAVQVTQTGDAAWSVEVHNPTSVPVKTALRVNPFFDPLKGKRLPAGVVTIPPGASIRREL